ncbi:DUF624 domain-containing protein [Bacillus subtilis]
MYNAKKGGGTMEHDGSLGRMLRFCEWIMRFAYTNLLWLFFTLLGLGVFGIMPATAALFAVMRKWIQGRTTFTCSKRFGRNTRVNFFVQICSALYWRSSE